MSGDIFLKFEGDEIKGESKDSVHKDAIHVLSVSWGVSQGGSFSYGGGGGTGKATFQDVHFTKVVDKSSPVLFARCASGKHIPTAKVIFRKAGDKAQEYETITLSDLLVASFTQSDSGGSGSLSTEQISLNFSKIEFEYKEQMKDGSLGGGSKQGWDLKAHKKV